MQITLRLFVAALLGAVIGWQRESVGKAAGLRTHMLVCIGTTVFILACHTAGFEEDAKSRIIQGIVTGVGFMGAGAIMKLNEKQEIHGLTTAAGVWMTSGIGVAVGLGSLGVATLSTIVTYMILTLVSKIEIRQEKLREEKQRRIVTAASSLE